MKAQTVRYIKFGILPLFSGLFLFYILSGYGAQGDSRDNSRFRSDTLQVEVAQVALKDFNRSYRATGTLAARQHAMLRTIVGGPIEDIPVDVGDRVEKGDLLMQIREIDYKLALEQAEADLARAQAQVEEAERQKLRMVRLFENGSATEQERDQAVTAHNETLAVQLQAEAARNHALQNLKDSSIRAPYDGVITEREFEPGEYVSAGNPVIEILNLSLLEADLEIPGKYMGLVEMGSDILVEFEGAYTPRTGRIVAVSPKVSSATRTFRIRVQVRNNDLALPSGQFISIQMGLRNLSDQVSIPADALVRRDGGSFVWIYQEGKARRRRIRDGIQQDGWILVQNGLRQGEEVITEGKKSLNDGYPVQIAEQTSKAK